MKLTNRFLRFGLIGIVTTTTLPFFISPAVLAEPPQREETIVSQAKQGTPKINLNLVVDKQVLTVDENGVEQISWKNMGTKVTVVPGNVLRYVITGKNQGNAPANDLNVTQPIPNQMVYVMGSASSSNNAKITYSIDNGETFVENPTIEVKQEDGTVVEEPAPASAYTHIRWEFESAIAPEEDLEAMYKVEVE